MISKSIRPISLAIIRRGDQILLMESRDRTKGETFYRPLGGGMEFGETAAETVRREFQEELGAEIRVKKRLGCFENRFEYEGEAGHEIVFVFEAEFVDRKFYKMDELSVSEGTRQIGKATWISLNYLQHRNTKLYPEGVLEVILAEHFSENTNLERKLTMAV